MKFYIHKCYIHYKNKFKVSAMGKSVCIENVMDISLLQK